jgi:hypothetical protein
VILGILNDLPGTPVYTDRLLRNSQDMAAALTPYYGEDAGELGDLIRDHLVIAAQILQAIHDGEPTEDLIASWYANGNDIASKMNEMNPEFWPLDEAQPMWRGHWTRRSQRCLRTITAISQRRSLLMIWYTI